MTTNHLTADQLSALVDGALAARALEDAERHLASCPACREALAALSAQEEAMRRVMTHEPGEAYFASFADRVGNRIRAEGLAGAQRRGAAEHPRQVSSWGSPRTLAWLGTVAAVVVGAGITFLVTREPNVGALRDQRTIERATRAAAPAPADEGKLEPSPGANERQNAAAPEAGAKQGAEALGAREKEAEPGVPKTKASSEVRGFAAPPSTPGPPAAAPSAAAPPVAGAMRPGRAQEVRRDERGEDVPVNPPSGPAALYARPPAPETAPAAPGQPVYVKKHAPALPMNASERQAMDRVQAAPGATGAPAPAVRAEESVGAMKSLVEKDAAREPLCGEVRDLAGRPVANASVVLPEFGASTTTDARGHFCIAAPAGERTLSVLAVGFEPVRQTVSAGGGAPALSVVLQPVAVLGGSGWKGFRESIKAPAGAHDVLASLPDSLKDLARHGRLLTASASRLKSAAAWEAAADPWSRLVAVRPGGATQAEAIYQLAGARFHAWEITPTLKRREAAARAVEACLAASSPGAQRDQARVWQERLRR